MKEFVQRNMPIFVIGGITLLTFVVIILLAQKQQPDKPYLVKVDNQTLFADYTPTVGNADAPVTLVEFSDFECPACAAYHPYVKNVLSKYKDLIYFGYRHFPLPQHPNSQNAAIAAIAAGEQGKFFEYGDILFANQEALTETDLERYARDLGLDIGKFNNDLNRDDLKQRIIEDLRVVYELKISATPTFYLNGNIMDIKSFSDFETQILRAVDSAGGIPSGVDPIQQQLQEETNTTTPSQTQPAQDVPEISQIQAPYEISYTDSGFSPTSTTVTKNRIIKWTNNSAKDIKFRQLIKAYDDLKNPVDIKAGESFEFKLTKPGLFTYEEVASKSFGKITVLDTKSNN